MLNNLSSSVSPAVTNSPTLRRGSRLRRSAIVVSAFLFTTCCIPIKQPEVDMKANVVAALSSKINQLETKIDKLTIGGGGDSIALWISIIGTFFSPLLYRHGYKPLANSVGGWRRKKLNGKSVHCQEVCVKENIDGKSPLQ